MNKVSNKNIGLTVTIKTPNKDDASLNAAACFYSGYLFVSSDSLSKSEMVLMRAFLLDCADALQTEINNGIYEIKH